MSPAASRAQFTARVPVDCSLISVSNLVLHPRYLPQLVPILLDGADNMKDEDIRQCCQYGLGLLAEHIPAAFVQVLPQALEKILRVIQHPQAREDDNESATDNAVSALGKVIEFHGASLPDPKAAAAVYLGYLPVRGDEVEAKVVHGQLLRFVQGSTPLILGDNNANLGRVVGVLAEAAASDSLTNADTRQGIKTLLQQMQAAMGGVFTQLVSGLSPAQQQALAKVFA